MFDVTVNREVASSYGIGPSTIDNTLDDALPRRKRQCDSSHQAISRVSPP